MEIIFKDYPFLNNKLNLTISSNSLVGVTGPLKEEFIATLSLINLKKEAIFISDNKVTKENIKVFRKRIGIVSKDIALIYYSYTVREFLLQEIRTKELNFTDTAKKLKDSLKIVGLPISFLSMHIRNLSTLERKLILLAKVLLSNPNIIILDEPSLGIDLLNEKRIMRLLLKIQEKYQKTLIFSTNDTNYLYKYSKQTLIFTDKTLLVSGPTEEVFQNVELLKENKISLPPIVEFSYLAKKEKKVKIDYHKDIRDIIKDIYKHI